MYNSLGQTHGTNFKVSPFYRLQIEPMIENYTRPKALTYHRYLQVR